MDTSPPLLNTPRQPCDACDSLPSKNRRHDRTQAPPLGGSPLGNFFLPVNPLNPGEGSQSVTVLPVLSPY